MLDLNNEVAISILESGDEFTVDFEQAWVWLGYSAKHKAKEALTSNFEQGLDFNSVTLKVECADGKGFSRREQIYLTTDCFKAWCMMANTAQGKEVRKYFLAVEKDWKKQKLEVAYLRQQNEELKAAVETRRNLHPNASVVLNVQASSPAVAAMTSKLVVELVTGIAFNSVKEQQLIDNGLSGKWSIDHISDPVVQEAIVAVKQSLAATRKPAKVMTKAQCEVWVRQAAKKAGVTLKA